MCRLQDTVTRCRWQLVMTGVTDTDTLWSSDIGHFLLSSFVTLHVFYISLPLASPRALHVINNQRREDCLALAPAGPCHPPAQSVATGRRTGKAQRGSHSAPANYQACLHDVLSCSHDTWPEREAEELAMLGEDVKYEGWGFLRVGCSMGKYFVGDGSVDVDVMD